MIPGTARESLLVVDDDKIILDLLCRTFKTHYEVHSADSGEAALVVLAEHHIDLLITDQKMPGMTGLDLIAEARKALPELQAILLTAYTEPEDLIAAINEGRVYRYVTKPWNTADLVITVRNALEAVALRRERDGLLGRLQRRLQAMSVLVEISASAGALQSHAQVVELVARALPRIVAFDVAATLVVPPGVGGPGPATMHLHCAEPGVADEALLLAARDRALDIYNQLVGGQGHAIDQDTLIVNVSGQRMRAAERTEPAPRSEIRSSLHLPIMAPGAQGGVTGLLYVASLSPGRFTEDDEQNLEVLSTQTAELLRRLSARILDERRKMELMVASMADGLIMTDATGEVFLLNPAARKMLGVVGDEAVTAKYLKERLGFYPFDLVRSTQQSATPLREELKVNDRFLHSIVSPVNDQGGASVGVVVVLRDITEQKALDHRKEEFVSIVSHELRTPLTSITGALDIVLTQYAHGLTDKQSRYLQMALESAQKLNGIVDDLLDVAKVERGKLSMRMGALDLGALAREAVDRFRAAGEQKNIQLGVRAPVDGEVRIVADADRLTQVINNLLSNAIKFTPEGGRIEVDIFGPQVSRSFVGLSIWNNGVSISAEDRERVFDKFEQIQSSNTRKVGGTGLGLAISRGIVEGHGGRIWVEGTRDEEGTRFVVALPNTPPEGAESATDPRTPSVTARSVLVVDDDRYTTYILKGMLVAAGYKVYLAHDGDQALGIAREKKPDLVTVDLRMPNIDGLALVEILKHDPDTRKMPIIVLSVSDERDRAAAVGADAFLHKPVDSEPLIECIARLLSERGKSRQKILLVDDDPGIRMICRDVLEGQGYVVREAEDGDKATIEARRFRPDLVLVDVMMPGMDGFTLAQKLRSDRETSLTPIIFLSARGQTVDKVRAFKLGAEDYLVKPFDSAELVARVEKALARRDLELGASPTTRLPGSQAIEAEIDRRLAASGDFAFCYLDLDNLKAFNDYYGYAKADGVILQTGDIVREVVTRVGGPGDFIGHIAGDDFVFITTRDLADRVCQTVIDTFDRLVPLYYNKVDRERGFIETNDRYGVLRRFPIMSVSIACVTRSGRAISTHSDLSAASAELKQRAKAIHGSAFVRDGNVIFPRPAADKAG
ncbi:MAG: response regulator receiver modulated diguanylate cyclase with sensor [Myxococcales bacterium]|nr:response regulator receiver modulated diguanylate cyclase with sensor [Myxococcales bacterium]